jgi:hypothetical protein
MPILKKYPDLLDEMQGVADGAGVNLPSIIALNVRTEITYGLMKVCSPIQSKWEREDEEREDK